MIFHILVTCLLDVVLKVQRGNGILISFGNFEILKQHKTKGRMDLDLRFALWMGGRHTPGRLVPQSYPVISLY